MLRPLLKLRGLSLVAFSALALLQISAHAELTVEITGAGANRIPLAIADFGGDPGSSRALTAVVRGDLERSGLFKLVDPSGIAMTEATSPAYGLAQQINAIYGAWMAERSRTNARSQPGERTRADMFKDDFKFFLEQLFMNDLSLAGVPAATSSVSRARPWAGGISVCDKESAQSDSDRVKPRFGRDMHSDPLRPRSGDGS